MATFGPPAVNASTVHLHVRIDPAVVTDKGCYSGQSEPIATSGKKEAEINCIADILSLLGTPLIPDAAKITKGSFRGVLMSKKFGGQ